MLRTGAAPATDVFPRRGRQRADWFDGGLHRRRHVDRLGGREDRLRARLRRCRRHPRRRRHDRDQVPEHVVESRTLPAWTEPRIAPPALLPAAAGAIVLAVALPIFLLAGWRVSGWAIGAVLWLGSEALRWVMARLPRRAGNLA